MKTNYFLYSAKPFDFRGHCCHCTRKTDHSLAIDLNNRDLSWIAELFFPPVAMLRLKSVSIPYCPQCRESLHSLRIGTLAACTFFIGLIAYASFVMDRRFLDHPLGAALVIMPVFALLAIPFVYTELKEKRLGAKVFLVDGKFRYRFRNDHYLTFLHNQGLCKQVQDDLWVGPAT